MSQTAMVFERALEPAVVPNRASAPSPTPLPHPPPMTPSASRSRTSGSVERVARTVNPATPAPLVFNAPRPNQQALRGTAADLADFDDVVVATGGALVSALRGLTPVLGPREVERIHAVARRPESWE